MKQSISENTPLAMPRRRSTLIAALALLTMGSPALQAQLNDAATKAAAHLVDPHVIAQANGQERHVANGSEEAYLPILYPSSHAANLIQLQNGDVLCFWFSGSWEGNSQVGIVMSRLKKGETRWSETQLIDRKVGESYQNPVPFQAPDGTLHLFHTTQPADLGESNTHTLELISKDNGKTWEGPHVLFAAPGSYARHPVVVLQNGSWLLPMNYQASTGQGTATKSRLSMIKLSKDQGKTWKECPIPGTDQLLQPTVVKLANGGLLTYLRSGKADSIYSSTSVDGCNWTPAKATSLPNNNASVQLLRLKNGHLVLVFNNSTTLHGQGGLRKPLSIALSTDEGKTWSAVRDIEAGRPGLGEAERQIKAPGREEYSYPSVIQLTDGTIMTAFTYRRQTMKVVSFTEDWITKGTTSGVFKSGKTAQ